ncbi:MAG: MFS transporter [Bryobacterales bacterium]|nr:MFS transporter [Bryobacterales bacterium]
MISGVGARLAVMMFLQFFVWGAWYVTAPLYLGKIGFSGADFGLTYSVGPIAAIISPLFVGMVADRFFPTEKVLGVLHILGGALMWSSTMLMNPEAPGSPFAINMIFFAHTLCYFPTLALTNSIAMHNIQDSEKEFPLIRVFGTIGWIVAGVTLTWLGWDDKISMFYLTGASGVLLGLYCFSLPHTPPPAKGQKATVGELLGADALVLFKNRSFTVFVLSSFLICIPLAFYYQMAAKSLQQTGVADVAFTMSFGQMSEIFFMLAMPLFFKKLGVKWMLAVGMLAWIVRYGLFAAGAPSSIAWMMIAGILLHGICYDFFFVTGQIYTDQVAHKGIRSQAQGLLAMLTLGLGMLIGAQAAGVIEEKYTPPQSRELSAEVQQLGARISQAGEGSPEAQALAAEQSEKALEALRLVDWKMIWTIPAALAGLILLMFVAVFKNPKAAAR